MWPKIIPKFNGVFAVIKPKGVTSAGLLNSIYEDLISELRIMGTPEVRGSHKRKLFKMGHGGTLDSEAVGVLTVGIGKGCSCLPAFLHGQKRYLSSGRLGTATDSMDASGTVINELPFNHVTREQLQESLQTFVGECEQVPPIYSALKIDGKRMSDMARAGEEVTPKPARKVEVYHLKCTEFNPPLFKLDVGCGGGFYVRKLIHDVGQALGTCAHMIDLERTQHGPFTTNMAIPTGRWDVFTIIEAVENNRQLITAYLKESILQPKESTGKPYLHRTRK